jgi:hypothetical protein
MMEPIRTAAQGDEQARCKQVGARSGHSRRSRADRHPQTQWLGRLGGSGRTRISKANGRDQVAERLPGSDFGQGHDPA